MDDEPNDDPTFLAWVALHEWLIGLADEMREDARLLREESLCVLAAAARLDPGR